MARSNYYLPAWQVISCPRCSFSHVLTTHFLLYWRTVNMLKNTYTPFVNPLIRTQVNAINLNNVCTVIKIYFKTYHEQNKLPPAFYSTYIPIITYFSLKPTCYLLPALFIQSLCSTCTPHQAPSQNVSLHWTNSTVTINGLYPTNLGLNIYKVCCVHSSVICRSGVKILLLKIMLYIWRWFLNPIILNSSINLFCFCFLRSNNFKYSSFCFLALVSFRYFLISFLPDPYTSHPVKNETELQVACVTYQRVSPSQAV